MPFESTPYHHVSDSSSTGNHWKLAACFMLGAALSSAVATLRSGTPNTILSAVDGNSHVDHPSRAATAVPASIPHKFGIDGTTPVELQLSRGTCWVFAAVAVLEYAYRKQGVENGWLQPLQYVRLSEQAFGISVLDACLMLPTNQSCVIGKEVWRGRQLMPINTEGGDAELLFYLKSLSTTAALPWSVCRYTPRAGKDHHCPGLAQAQRLNPLGFSLASISWLYERQAVKARLLESQRLMSFSTGMVSVRYLLPCTAKTAAVLRCDPEDEATCEPCPPASAAFSKVACCVMSERESNTMEGEFFRLPPASHPEPLLEGAHAMALVGYSDTYRTHHGYVGGWILKNSWCVPGCLPPPPL